MYSLIFSSKRGRDVSSNEVLQRTEIVFPRMKKQEGSVRKKTHNMKNGELSSQAIDKRGDAPNDRPKNARDFEDRRFDPFLHLAFEFQNIVGNFFQ